MKILLLGKNGQIGRELTRALIPLGEVIALGRDKADLQDSAGLLHVLQSHAPDVIVNAAAYTAVDAAESDVHVAYAINAEAVEIVAKYAHKSGALLVHYSTDYVFDGEKPGAYVESDVTNPLNVYGKSKRAGEVAVEQSGCDALIFRTSWVFSAHGNNFIKTVLRLAKDRESLNVVVDQHGVPTSAELIADVTALSILGQRKQSLPNGTYHLTAAGEATWFELARYVVSRAIANGVALMLQPHQIHAIATEEYPLPAKRPVNSCLNTTALSTALGMRFPDWRVHTDRVVDQLTQFDAIV